MFWRKTKNRGSNAAMNYLAHFHLAGDDPGYILGALLGDFVKGEIHSDSFHAQVAFKELPASTINGIVLHRKIDALFDSDPQVRQLASLLPEASRRFNGIVLDLFFDYALSHHWQRYSDTTLAAYTKPIAKLLAEHQHLFCARSRIFCTRLVEHKLLNIYHQKSVVNRVALGIGKRLQREALIQSALHQLWAQEEQCIEYFLAIYPVMQNLASQQRDKLIAASSLSRVKG